MIDWITLALSIGGIVLAVILHRRHRRPRPAFVVVEGHYYGGVEWSLTTVHGPFPTEATAHAWTDARPVDNRAEGLARGTTYQTERLEIP